MSWPYSHSYLFLFSGLSLASRAVRIWRFDVMLYDENRSAPLKGVKERQQPLINQQALVVLAKSQNEGT